MVTTSRRAWFRAVLAALGAYGMSRGPLADAGVTFTRPPEAEDWGGQVASFLDPDGNLIQLMQFPG